MTYPQVKGWNLKFSTRLCTLSTGKNGDLLTPTGDILIIFFNMFENHIKMGNIVISIFILNGKEMGL